MNTATIIKDNHSLNWVSELKYNSLPSIKNVAFVKDEMAFELSDGRVIYVPTKWSKKLLKATSEQRKNFKTNGTHVFWDEIDEIIGVKNILFGKQLFL